MEYGGPCYSRNGEVEVGFASQKNFIGLYLLRVDVINAHRDASKACGECGNNFSYTWSEAECVVDPPEHSSV